ncbi:MAG TPA: DNA-binding protein [Streptosporangiaceae bacterium]|nr:DNA-binding protein [Streptosporangiaceae bacterium]
MPSRRKPERLAKLIPAAEYCQLSVKTLRRRLIDGTLTPYRLGPKLLAVDLDEVDRKLIRPVAVGGGDAA